MHKIGAPAELATVDELIVPTSYKAMSNDDPAFALFVFYPQAGLVEVLPQKWFTSAQYRVGQQWITRAARDPESQRRRVLEVGERQPAIAAGQALRKVGDMKCVEVNRRYRELHFLKLSLGLDSESLGLRV